MARVCVDIIPEVDPCLNAFCTAIGHEARSTMRGLAIKVVDEFNETVIGHLRAILEALYSRKQEALTKLSAADDELQDINDVLLMIDDFLVHTNCPPLEKIGWALEKRRGRLQALIDGWNALLARVDGDIDVYADLVGDSVCWVTNMEIVEQVIDLIENPPVPPPVPACGV